MTHIANQTNRTDRTNRTNRTNRANCTNQVPVTVIGGFLGSGKTTLLNSVLGSSTGVRYAVMVNDFCDLAIDTISFANGCVCCSLGDNLLALIDRLLDRDPPPEHFLIEVSGVANPKVIADVATLHPRLQRDLIIILADATSVRRLLADVRLVDTLVMQLIPADLIVLNKCDLMLPDELSTVRQILEKRFDAPLIKTVQAALPAAVLSAVELPVSENPAKADANAIGNANAKKDAEFRHDPEKQFYRQTIKLPGTLRQHQLEKLLLNHQSILIRAKGFVFDNNTPAALTGIQFSGHRVDINPVIDPALTEAVLVVIAHQPLTGFVEDLAAGNYETK